MKNYDFNMLFLLYLISTGEALPHVASRRHVPAYLCKTGFSHYLSTKTKYRSRLDAEADKYIQLSSITPDIRGVPRAGP